MGMKASVIEYEMGDGSMVGLSLNMAGIYELKQSDEKAYKTVNKVLMDGTSDAAEMLEVLYASFKIANADSEMELIEFLENANTAFLYNAETVNGMISRKKK